MFERFFHGKCSLSEAFWKYCIFGLFCAAGISRLLMIGLKQTVGYNTNFMQVFWQNISIISMNPNACAWMCFYIASVLGVIVYSIICIISMYNTYREYEKSKILAIICMLLNFIAIYVAIKTSLY
jgi:hypothetical protein